MKKLYYYYKKYKVLRIILFVPRLLINFLKYDLVTDEYFVKKRFQKILGYKLDLNNPKNFNEKLQWLKLNDRTELHTLCADKLLVRDYIERKIGKQFLIPNYLATNKPEDIVPENMPDCPVIIKTNHDSGTYFIVRDKNTQDWNAIQKALKKSLKRNYYRLGKEWQYKNIKPQIIVEKLLSTEEGEIPNDYKLHCINGKLAFIQVDTDRMNNHHRNIYDCSWKLLDCELNYKKGDDIAPPFRLSKMIELAEILANKFYFARIDFYEVDKKIFFGEITFHPEAGFGRFSPKHWDEYFGSMLKLPIDE